MNTYHKYCPNVFVAKCEAKHEKGEIIDVQTRRGKVNKSLVWNYLGFKGEFFFYSITRADGFDRREWAKRRQQRMKKAAENSAKKAAAYREAANEGAEFLALGEPIKIGHHSEKRHRSLIERNHRRMSNWYKNILKQEAQEQKAAYMEKEEVKINLSMPESIAYFTSRVEECKAVHAAIKSGKTMREHDYSLTYAKKAWNAAQKALDLAVKLWG